ncbi:hypothetical protein MTP99_010109 [Tenebrio molitor]|jgi:hypothetical protein|nr:hypothetical protein MTP99_010109 [Tenebrio molitor]
MIAIIGRFFLSGEDRQLQMVRASNRRRMHFYFRPERMEIDGDADGAGKQIVRDASHLPPDRRILLKDLHLAAVKITRASLDEIPPILPHFTVS